MVAEIEIPQVINGSQLSDLRTANVLRSFGDIPDGHMNEICSTCPNDTYSQTVKIGGLLVFGNKIYGTVYAYYDAAVQQDKSHFFSYPNLNLVNDFRGMYTVEAPQAGFVSGYMSSIPPEWQSELGGLILIGQCCIAIISRSSFGPAVFALNPNDLSVRDPVPSVPLLYYPESNPSLNGMVTISHSMVLLQFKGFSFRQGHGVFCLWVHKDKDRSVMVREEQMVNVMILVPYRKRYTDILMRFKFGLMISTISLMLKLEEKSLGSKTVWTLAV